MKPAMPVMLIYNSFRWFLWSVPYSVIMYLVYICICGQLWNMYISIIFLYIMTFIKCTYPLKPWSPAIDCPPSWNINSRVFLQSDIIGTFTLHVPTQKRQEYGYHCLLLLLDWVGSKYSISPPNMVPYPKKSSLHHYFDPVLTMPGRRFCQGSVMRYSMVFQQASKDLTSWLR